MKLFQTGWIRQPFSNAYSGLFSHEHDLTKPFFAIIYNGAINKYLLKDILNETNLWFDSFDALLGYLALNGYEVEAHPFRGS